MKLKLKIKVKIKKKKKKVIIIIIRRIIIRINKALKADFKNLFSFLSSSFSYLFLLK